MRVLVTGGAGFIGSHSVEALLDRGYEVSVIDNLDPYYDPAIKRANLARFRDRVRWVEGDLRDEAALGEALEGAGAVLHLAARAGVRRSIAEPALYVDNNVLGIQRLLDGMQARGVDRLVYASSSSVYGARTDGPFRESDPVAAPESPYAATKMAGELMAYAASRSWGVRVTCCRLFTVYGPRQRPEMAVHLFARKALAGEPIQRFGDGRSRRDYTYVGDIAQGLIAALERPEPFAVYNLAGGSPVTLNELLQTIEEVFGVPLDVRSAPDQPGDVPVTWADTSRARERLDFRPQVGIREGVERFRAWLLGR
jgi:UDP-glucuronate 4-epimerase